jgi:cytoskeletal protein RodZ
VQGTAIGVGAALRKVRASRGLSLDEAARDTRIRREFLEAVEEEDFHLLLGDVHVRGCLRTYASYLRLSPDKVVAAYAAALPEAEPASPVVSPQAEPVLGARRRRDNHRLIGMIAALVLIVFAAFGILSARQPAPPPADGASDPPSAAAVLPVDRAITVAVSARQPVDVTVEADEGGAERFALTAGEGRSFDAGSTITITLSDGDAARVTVNGTDQGYPGTDGEPWSDTFSYETEGDAPQG